MLGTTARWRRRKSFLPGFWQRASRVMARRLGRPPAKRSSRGCRLLGSRRDRERRWRRCTPRMNTGTTSPSTAGRCCTGRIWARGPTGRTNPAMDYTAVVLLTGLQPATEYTYRVLIDGEPQGSAHRLRTFPPEGSGGRFRIAMGGGAGFTPKYERMWDTILGFDPVAFLTLGDNVYIDAPEHPVAQRYCYYRRQSQSEFRRFA